MFGLNLLRNAVSRLAANLTGLADTVADINAHLRQRAALDGPEVIDTPALPSPQQANGATTFAQDGPEAADAPAVEATAQTPARCGRRKPAATAAE